MATPCHVTKDNFTSLTHFEIYELDEAAVVAAGGLDDAASTKVRKAFRRLSLYFHPDKDGSDEARDVFEHLKEAANVLQDAERCKEYIATFRVEAQEAEKKIAGRREAHRREAELRERESTHQRKTEAQRAADVATARERADGVGGAGHKAMVEGLRRSLLSSWEQMEEDMLAAYEVGPEELAVKERELERMLGGGFNTAKKRARVA